MVKRSAHALTPLLLCGAGQRTRYKCNTQETSTGWSWSRLCVPLALHCTYISRLLFAFGKGLGNRTASPLLLSAPLIPPCPFPPSPPVPHCTLFFRGLGHLLCSACLASTRPWDRSNLTQSRSEPGGSWRRTHKGRYKVMSTLLYNTFVVAYIVFEKNFGPMYVPICSLFKLPSVSVVRKCFGLFFLGTCADGNGRAPQVCFVLFCLCLTLLALYSDTFVVARGHMLPVAC